MQQSKEMFEDYKSENYSSDERYNMAYKRVKKIKGFYVHALVYVLINIFIISKNYYGNVQINPNFWSWVNFNTALFWGIGLAAHGLSVFGKNIFLGKNWEERKIQKLMENEKSEKWE